MDIGFGTLDVVVHIIPEQVNQVNGVVTNLPIGVSWKQDKGDVPNAFSGSGISSLESSRWILAEQNLRSSGQGPTTFLELLKENLAQNDIIVIFENCRKDDSYSVRLCFHKHGLIFPIMNDGLKSNAI